MEQKCSIALCEPYDHENPKSFMGRKFWRWHQFCPGWKAYFQSLLPKEQEMLRTSIISKVLNNAHYLSPFNLYSDYTRIFRM